MYLMYVDESGDCGSIHGGSPTRYFVLSGLVVHELRWQSTLERLIDFRRDMKKAFGLHMSEEFHAPRLISRPGDLVRIRKQDRLAMIRHFADRIAGMPDINLINVVVDKRGKIANYDAFQWAWTAMIQRFENTISHRNFVGPQNSDERGLLFPDRTDDKKLRLLVRKMRRYNPVSSRLEHQAMGAPSYRNLVLTRVVEDPNMRDSEHSYFIQIADLAAFLLYQFLEPSAYMREKGGKAYFRRLDPVICKAVSRSDQLGIVRL